MTILAHLFTVHLVSPFPSLPRRLERKPASDLRPQPEILSILPSLLSEHTKGKIFLLNVYFYVNGCFIRMYMSVPQNPEETLDQL